MASPKLNKILRSLWLLASFARAITCVHDSPKLQSISGLVVDRQGVPLIGANIRVNRIDVANEVQGQTNEQGEFTIEAPTPGWYSVRATKTGFVASEFGETNVGEMGTPIVL